MLMPRYFVDYVRKLITLHYRRHSQGEKFSGFDAVFFSIYILQENLDPPLHLAYQIRYIDSP